MNLSESESAKSLDNAKIKKIKEDFNELRDRLLKPKIKEIRKNLYEIENKNLSESKTKEIEKNLVELEDSLFNPLSANPTKWSNTLKQFLGNS